MFPLSVTNHAVGIRLLPIPQLRDADPYGSMNRVKEFYGVQESFIAALRLELLQKALSARFQPYGVKGRMLNNIGGVRQGPLSYAQNITT